MWKGRISGVSHAHTARGRAPSLPNLWVPFFFCVHPLAHYQILHGNTYGEEACFRVTATAPSQRGGAPALPNLSDFPLSTTTLLKKMTKLGVETHMWEGHVFRRSATPLRLHKCVARFVSDSRVSCFICIHPISKSSPELLLSGKLQQI